MSTIEARFRIELAGFLLDAAFDAPGRGVTAIFGPSGSGKTTLLRCIAGLERPPSGFLRVNGDRWHDSDGALFTPAHRRPVGYVFQEGNLFPHLSVRGNLAYARRRARGAGSRIELDQAVGWLGIGGLLDRTPERLSGGERQRVAVARALLSGPQLLLLDEPLAGLDEESKAEILPYLDQLHRDLSIPVLYVSHSRAEVMRLADHVVLIDAGRVRAAGGVNEIVPRLDLSFGAEAEIGTIAEARVLASDEFGLTQLEIPGGRLWLPGWPGLSAGQRIRVRFLARDVSLTLERPRQTSILNVLPARITEIHDRRSVLPLVALDAGGTELLSRITRRSLVALDLQPGASVFAQIKGVALVP